MSSPPPSPDPAAGPQTPAGATPPEPEPKDGIAVRVLSKIFRGIIEMLFKG